MVVVSFDSIPFFVMEAKVGLDGDGVLLNYQVCLNEAFEMMHDEMAAATSEHGVEVELKVREW